MIPFFFLKKGKIPDGQWQESQITVNKRFCFNLAIDLNASVWLLMAHGHYTTKGHSLRDIWFAPLAPNKGDERRHRQKDSDNVQWSIMDRRRGKAIGLDKSSNLKSLLRKEALNEKTFTMAWGAQSMRFFYEEGN